MEEDNKDNPDFVPRTPQDIHIYSRFLDKMEQGVLLNLHEAAFLSIIQSFINKEKDCFVSNVYLAKKMRVSTSRIQQIMRRLKEDEILCPEYHNGRRYLYKKPEKDREK